MCLPCRPQSRGPLCPVSHHPVLFFFPELSCTSLEKDICPCCLWETQLCFSGSCLQGPTREDSIQRQTGQGEHRYRVAGWTQGTFLPGVTSNGSLRVPSRPLHRLARHSSLRRTSSAPCPQHPGHLPITCPAHTGPSQRRRGSGRHAPPRWGSGSSTCPARAARTPRGRCL